MGSKQNDEPQETAEMLRTQQKKLRTRRKRTMRFVVIIGLIVLLTAGIATFGLLGINYWMVRSTRERVVTNINDINATTLAVVPGARIYKGGRLSAYLQDRVDGAIKLYRAGKVKKILMSGDNSDRYYDESSAMRNYAIEHGVPEDDVLRDFAGLRTLDTVWRARDLWEQTDYVIVTQKFHMARALYLANALGIKAQGFVCDSRNYYKSVAVRLAVRESFARIGAWCDINVLRTKPRHLGKKESMSGIAQEREVKDLRHTIWTREKELRNQKK